MSGVDGSCCVILTMKARWCAPLALTLSLLACDDGSGTDADTASPPADSTSMDIPEDTLAPTRCQLSTNAVTPNTTTINGWTVALQDNGAWHITPPGGSEPVLEGTAACEDVSGTRLSGVRVATGEPFVLNLFGAFQIELTSFRTQLTWKETSGTTAVLTEVDGGALLSFALAEGGAANLRFAPRGDTDLQVTLEAEGADAGEVSMRCGEGEAFFGLGTQTYAMDLRGGTVPLWTQEQGIGKPEVGNVFPLNNLPEAAYAPMGVLHSSAGYTAVIGHDAYSEYDLCDDHDTRLVLRSHPELPAFVLVAGDTPRDRLSALTERYTGRLAGEPPAWVFAPWNDSVGGPERLAEVAETLRREDIPSSAIWTEDWIGGEQTDNGYRLSYAWEWDPAFYPDLGTDIERLHSEGFAFLGYFNTFVPQPTRMWEEGITGGYLVKNAAGEVYELEDPAFRTAGLVDLTNPDAVAWFEGYMTTAADTLGIDGWMADFSEWLPHDAVMFDGTTGWESHNRYPVMFQQLNQDVMRAVHEADPLEPDNNWTFYARSGWASVNGGSGGATATMWGGDQNTDWKYDDGFPTVIPAGTHVGLSGVPIFGTDIAGYSSFVNPNTNKELFLRWSSAGAFQGLMRTHHGSDECGNWSFDRDVETTEHFRRYAIIRTLLYPYLRSLVDEALSSGLPMMRHPYLVEPSASALWTGQDYLYFLGDALLVAPVLEEGAVSRDVDFPSEGWWPLFGSAPLAGGTQSVDASPTEIPVFVRPGTVLPLLARPVDSFYGASIAEVTDLDDVAGAYALALYPTSSGELESVSVGSATVTGSGISTSTDWTAGTLEGQALPSCDVAPVDTSCVDAAGGILLLVGDALSWSGASGESLVITGSEVQSYRVAVGGAVWGSWTEPTAITELDPDIPPPCEEP